MRILDRLRSWLLFPFRSRRRVLLAVLLFGLVGLAAWWGIRTVTYARAFDAAQVALTRYDYPTARGQLDRCLSLRPRDPAARLLAAQAARRDGRLDVAEEHLTHYREVAGVTPEGTLEGTLQRVVAGQVDENVGYLIRLVEEKNPATEQILEALAVGSIERYRVRNAGFWVGELLERYPRNPVGRLLRAQNTFLQGKYDLAVATCREILADFPHEVKARQYLAGFLFKTHKHAEALTEYEVLLRGNPDDSEARVGIVRSLNRLGRTEELRPLVRELETRDADNPEALLECGRFALADNRPADAERLLRRAVRLAPHDQEVHFQLGAALEQLGKVEESRLHVAAFKRIEADMLRADSLLGEIEKNPTEVAARREMGRICLRNGQHREGLRWLYGVLDTAPNDRETHAVLADHFAALGDQEKAESHRARAR